MEIIFILFICLVIYTYVGYYFLLKLIVKINNILNKPFKINSINKINSNHNFYISIIVAVFNEEKNIENKILNYLNLDYPRDLLELIIASDGYKRQNG